MNQQINNAARGINQTNPRINNTPVSNLYQSALRKSNSISNSSSSSSSGSYSGSKVIGIIILVVVIVLLVGACYWLYTVYSNRVFQTTVETSYARC